jgi:hypothetical protein
VAAIASLARAVPKPSHFGGTSSADTDSLLSSVSKAAGDASVAGREAASGFNGESRSGLNTNSKTRTYIRIGRIIPPDDILAPRKCATDSRFREIA